MKKILTLTILVLLLGSAFSTYAQKNRVPSKKPKNQLKLGDRYYAESYWYDAIEYYKDVVRQDSANRYALYWLSMSLLQARDYANSEIFFREFYAVKPANDKQQKKFDKEDQVLFNKGRFYFGQVLHRNGHYDEAIEQLSKFNSTYQPKDEDDNLKTLAKIELDGCEFAKAAPKAKVKVINAGPGVNRSYNEASPFGIGEDQLYYSSIKIDAMTGGDSLVFVSGNKSKRTYQLMKSTAEGTSWSKGKPVENSDINEKGYIFGNGAFNHAATRFYFTKCLEVDDDRPLCNIFVADYNNGTFSNVTRVPEPINSKEKYTATQPTVRTSADGMDIVYFVSDRPHDDAKGGKDIWYFMRTQNGEFKGPNILKGGINTPGDEVTPYFDDSTQTLYFSSNGRPGFGGYDVYRTTEQPDLSWGEVTNIGSPVNTGADDIYYTRSTDQTNGFVVSNREGSVPLNGIKTASDDVFTWTNFKYAVQGIAFKEGNEGGGALVGAKFSLYRKAEDGTRVLVAIDSVHTDGFYFFKLQPETDYIVEVDRPGFQTKSESITTKGLPGEDTLDNNINIRKAMYVLKGTTYEEGKPDVKIKDADVELREIYPNGMEKTVYYQKSNPYFYFDVDMGKKYKLITRKEGYFANTTDLNTAGLGQVDTVTKDIPIAKLEVNKTYTLQNVLYEFGKATLTENSKAVLDNLYQIMVENPSFIIELSAHTDAIGSDAANLKLSQARAEACVTYLASKGIAKDRMVAKGYGESKPKVPNTKEDGSDDPAGRAINRRTEFQITGFKKEQ